MVTTKSFVGEQIQCWVPGHFTSNYEDYTNKVCWVSNTYYIPINEDIPKEHESRQMISYYQWVPMILFTEAILFYIPCLLWRAFNNKSGIEINHIVDAGKQLHDSENKMKTLRYMMRMMDRYLGHYRDHTRGCLAGVKQRIMEKCPLVCGRKYGNYLVTLYLSIKGLYLINVVGQLFLLDLFLGYDFHFYGFHILRSMLRNEDWEPSIRFPRVTLCDFKVRQLGNVHRHTVQCVLPINFFNEKIFIFIWCWYTILALITIGNFVIWIGRSVFYFDQIRYVRRHLRVTNRINDCEEKKYSRRFTVDYLRYDGVLVIRLVAANAGDLCASEFTAELWDHFRENPPNYYKKNENGDPDMLDDVDV